METSTFGPITDWSEVIKKEVKGLNDADFGEVQEVNENYVLTQKGTLNKEKFSLPKSIPHGYNGRILLFDITEEEAKKRFVIDKSALSSSESREKSEFQRQDLASPIPVIEERLEISKKETIVEAKVIKKPVKETKSVEVELTHEELIIEKRPIDDNTSSSSSSSTTTTASQSATQSSPLPSEEMTQSKIEISIPLKKEDVVVSKKSFVKEEIIIKKKPITETKTITEQIISEKVSVINADGEEVIEEVGSEE
jgi:stress response protein YsnF